MTEAGIVVGVVRLPLKCPEMLLRVDVALLVGVYLVVSIA